MTRIVIGIPTFKRPLGLERLLNSLNQIEVTEDIKVSLLIADNDPNDQQGYDYCKKFEKQCKFEVKAILVPEPGIPNVRNALLDEGFNKLLADFIAMIDDDEIVEPQWLLQLYATSLKTNADVVGGYVLPYFTAPPPSWTEGLDLYYRPKMNDGLVYQIYGTTSVLISSSIWTKFNQPTFNTSYRMSGGSDNEFFSRLKSLGAVFAFAAKAISHEFFEESRITKPWAKERAKRIGSGDMKIATAEFNETKKIVISIIKLFLGYGMRWVQYKTTSHEIKKFHAQLKLERQRGKLQYLMTRTSMDVYSKTHGQ